MPPPKSPYSWAVLRYMPDPVKQEFVNVAVAVHAPDFDFVGARHGDVADRLRGFFPGVDTETVTADIGRIEAAVASGGPDLSITGIADAAVPQDLRRHFYWSDVRFGQTADPRAELAALCDRMTGDRHAAPSPTL